MLYEQQLPYEELQLYRRLNVLESGSLYSSVAERQSCKLKVLGSNPSGGSTLRYRQPIQ